MYFSVGSLFSKWSPPLPLLGSRSALVNMEARGEGANMLNRKCVVVRWKDLSSEKFLDLIQRGAGAILVLLPQINETTDDSIMSVSIITR